MINTAIADDHTLFRQSFSHLLRASGDFDVTIEAPDGQSLLDQLVQSSILPDIVLLDIQMPVLDGKETAIFIRSLYPGIKIIAISAFDHEDLIAEMLYYGAVGFVTKNIDHNGFLLAIRSVLDQQTCVIGNDLTPRLYGKEELNENFKHRVKEKILTERQRFFIQQAASSLTYKEIGIKMGISLKTVDRYRDDLFHKLNVKSRVELALYLVRNGYADV